jgi:hypothetical protein
LSVPLAVALAAIATTTPPRYRVGYALNFSFRVMTFRKMRKKKKKEEKESLVWALIPGPLPYQGNVQPFPLNQITKAVEVVGSKAPAQGLDWLGFQEYLSKTCGSKTLQKSDCYMQRNFIMCSFKMTPKTSLPYH